MPYFYNISTLTDDPLGIRKISSPTSSMEAILVPRTHCADFAQLAQGKQAGVYLLYNTADKGEKPEIYIGQAGGQVKGTVASRLHKHDKKKAFWNCALVFIEKGNANSLTATHTMLIESILIQKAKTIDAVTLENTVLPTPPSAPQEVNYAAQIWSEEVVAITKIIGLPFFVQQTVSPPPPPPAKPTHYQINGGASKPFQSWKGAVIDFCNEIIGKVGMERFTSIALTVTVTKTGDKLLFAENQQAMGGLRFHQFHEKLFMRTSYSGKKFITIASNIEQAFPGMKLEFIYDDQPEA